MIKFGSSQPVRRIEDPRLLQGRGRYTDDITPPGTLYGAVVRSPHAAARIVLIDTDVARAAPGVLGIYTSADLEADGLGPIGPAFRGFNIGPLPIASGRKVALSGHTAVRLEGSMIAEEAVWSMERKAQLRPITGGLMLTPSASKLELVQERSDGHSSAVA